MKTFRENDRVIYTDPQGKKIDTFVVFDTDKNTGITHINHQDLRVSGNFLKAHPRAVPGAHMPFKDAFSFEILRKLKGKYRDQGTVSHLKQYKFAKAS